MGVIYICTFVHSIQRDWERRRHGGEWGLLGGQTKPKSTRREGYFNVILSFPTLDKGLAALKLAVTSKHSLWCSSYSLMGTWLMADALKAHSSLSPNAKWNQGSIQMQTRSAPFDWIHLTLTNHLIAIDIKALHYKSRIKFTSQILYIVRGSWRITCNNHFVWNEGLLQI